MSEGVTSSGIVRAALRWILWAALALFLLRTFVIALYTIPSRSMAPTIEPGSIVLVNKLPFTIRSPQAIPFTTIGIPHFTIESCGEPERGDIVLFFTPEPNRSSSSNELVKRVVALPGDRVRLTDAGVRVINDADGVDTLYAGSLPRQVAALFEGGAEVVVPAEGDEIRLTPAIAHQWRRILRREGIEVAIRNNIVFLNGNPATRYRFRSDYFLPLGDNPGNSRDGRGFGLVRRGSLIGEVLGR